MPAPVPPDDWRRQGQERYLTGARLTLRPYTPHRPGWDHDHCAFCGVKFMPAPTPSPDILDAGHATDDLYHWVCPPCHHDFKDEFRFTTD